MKIGVAILTVSDKASMGLREDASGPAIAECLKDIQHEVIWSGIVPDERTEISARLLALCDQMGADVILTTGGTGLAPRDVTPEATMDVAEKTVPGIAEAMRVQSAAKAPRSMLSRGVTVVRGSTLIVNLPGSPKAVRECMEVILPVLEHAVEVMKGDVTECARPEH
ncbi:MAG: molybdenum cofactor biosynthesis protein B [Butyricicoccus sp.]